MEDMRVIKRRWDDWPALELRSRQLQAVMIPGLGGKLVSLRHSGREWLWQNPQRPLRQPEYGADFLDYDVSGFDECFPTILPCTYPEEPWRGRQLPGHGELWSLPWERNREAEKAAGEVVLQVEGRALPYRFSRTAAVEENRLRLSYRVENLGEAQMRAAWWAHPLVALEPGMRIEAPAITTVKVAASLDGSLPEGAQLPWPGGGAAAPWPLNQVRSPQQRLAFKLFSQRLPKEPVSVAFKARDGASLTFQFDGATLPHVALWLNYGGLFQDELHFNGAVEPCMVGCDSLEEALKGPDAVPRIPAGGQLSWSLVVSAQS